MCVSFEETRNVCFLKHTSLMNKISIYRLCECQGRISVKDINIARFFTVCVLVDICGYAKHTIFVSKPTISNIRRQPSIRYCVISLQLQHSFEYIFANM